jgi:signal transduction histidine kinase
VGGVTFQDHPLHCLYFVLDNSAHKELEQRKDAFISMAGHEFRTPLTALKLQTQLLEKQLARQGIQACTPALSKMEAQVNRVTRLVGELLDVAKIQAGRLEYTREPVDLDMLLRETVNTMQQAYPTHAIVLREMTHAVLVGDQDRLEQVFTNLISNAIKYAPDAPLIEVALNTSEEVVTISVRDQGIGIPREMHGRIFERFYRAVPLRQCAFPGLGMGLYIVAEIVKHHGGTIRVESERGKGATFHVTFPLAASREEVTRGRKEE